MPKVLAKILTTKITPDGWLTANVRFNRKMPNAGENITVKWGATRTLSQNNLYWKYLTWLINDAGLEEHGHFSPQALHEDLKAYLISEKIYTNGQFKVIEEATTTTMDKAEFSDYLAKVEKIILVIFGVNSNSFWEEHSQNVV